MHDLKLSTEQQNQLQSELKSSAGLRAYRRAAALLAVHEGRPISQVAAFLGVTRQTIYNWLLAYVRAGQIFSLADAPRAGRPSVWAEEWDALLEETLQQFPVELCYRSRSWNAPLLQEHLASRLGKRVSKDTLRRNLRRLGYVWKHGRYVQPLGSELEAVPTAASTTMSGERETIAA